MRTLSITLAVAALLATAGCSNMTPKQRNTAIGAGVGGVAGATLIGGPGATIGGAALGGVVGNVLTDDHK
ncbi:osmotically inducible lipoprotein OsmB [Cupriavidus gilardii J11]|uniref:Osmotically inducible lipoprotein OsmB n=1 Tax=Cupriavidus gilardii J11 TaxID=936133 RepID=A0A562BGG4_9BURK|nr:glycine zipper 2TM domain-containing protein [Cupriavidus gilardii]TWG84274.1 osmotically inducible lipoprotein OsmB [Cupriavidus gilardii J11]